MADNHHRKKWLRVGRVQLVRTRVFAIVMPHCTRKSMEAWMRTSDAIDCERMRVRTIDVVSHQAPHEMRDVLCNAIAEQHGTHISRTPAAI